MRRYLPVLLCLLLCGCARKQESSAAECGDAILSSSTETTTSAPETTAATTDPTTTGSLRTMFTTTATDGTRFVGEGGEETGDQPAPEHFTFRFQPDGINVRLAGGNYQNLSCPLITAEDGTAEDGYYLADANFDGYYDLFVPCNFLYADTEYYIYLWLPEEKQFMSGAYMVTNPVLHPDDQCITSLRQKDDAIFDLLRFAWNDDGLMPTSEYVADYDALTLTNYDFTTGMAEPEPYDSTDALTAALFALQ